MEKTKYRQKWDLDEFFQGGSESPQFKKLMASLENEVNRLKTTSENFHIIEDINDSDRVAEIMEQISDIQLKISQATSFLTCLLAQNPKDQHANILRGKINSISARFDSSLKKVQKMFAHTNQKVWDAIIETDLLTHYTFILNEWREKARNLLTDKEENLLSDLMVDGYHGWGQFYNSLMSRIDVPVKISGTIECLSVAQAINLRSHPDKDVRKESHTALENIWVEKEELFGKIMNHLVGFRLQVYKSHNENVLDATLKDNRIKEETLSSMWQAVSNYKHPFSKYLNQKAEIFGDEKMKSYNFWAPITENPQRIHYDDAVDFILEHFCRFGPELERFSRKAFQKGWIEAEDRPNKSAISFCVSFPLSDESRIFTTYGGRFTNVLTLAHELGHAFHNHAMKPVNALHKKYPMIIAETASTLSEQIILDAALEKAETPVERLFLLDEKLKRSVMNFMNIHSRFLFESHFYKERREGIVPTSRINELMHEAIEQGYEGAMDHVSVHSWAWTPHFYLTNTPFYNFPYTFGYLFSLCIYAKAKEIGRGFEERYVALLRDSGSMSTEELVMKHLGEDITTVEFWEKGIQLCVRDADEFIDLTS
ncbi:M3 family oligoendopeptidase [Ferdinandcohnia sp. Marseille-Q9671]